MSQIKWVVLRTQPIHRCEFKVLHRITQAEYPAMLPCEVVYKKEPGKRHHVQSRYALFPTYVFAGLTDIGRDYDSLRDNIPEIKGILSRSRAQWSPYVLSEPEVEFIKKRVDESTAMTAVDFHKALKIGKTVEVSVGGTVQTTKIDAITKKGIRAMLQMFGAMHVIEVPFSAVKAA